MAGAEFKDHFSTQSAGYSRFRPRYPAELFSALAELTPGRELVWDCATGTGQAAVELARHFDRVVATDASAAQLAKAQEHPKVEYRVATAETSGLTAGSVDLVTVAQALHWFDLDRFYDEVRRVARPGGVLAVWTYNLLQITPEVDTVVRRYHDEEMEADWPPERHLVDSGYTSLPFPFPKLPVPDIPMEADWTLDGLIGYLGTWSAIQRYRRRTGEDPLPRFAAEVTEAWGEAETRRARWPLTVWAGTVHAP